MLTAIDQNTAKSKFGDIPHHHIARMSK